MPRKLFDCGDGDTISQFGSLGARQHSTSVPVSTGEITNSTTSKPPQTNGQNVSIRPILARQFGLPSIGRARLSRSISWIATLAFGSAPAIAPARMPGLPKVSTSWN